MSNQQSQLEVPRARPTLPISIGKKPFDRDFIREARKYRSNFRMRMRGDHAVLPDGPLCKHGNLPQGIHADPARDVVGVWSSTSQASWDASLLPSLIRQVAKNLAGK